jgi:hypothetical protein
VDGAQNFSATASTLSYRPTTNPLTSTDAGGSATISIAALTMLTSSKGSISVNSGSVTGLSYGTKYFIYYDDATLAGGSVSFNATTTKTTAINGVGRFYVGSIVTAVASGPSTTGANDGGVGAQAGQTFNQLGGTYTVVGGGSTVNPANGLDGDPTTYADVLATHGGSAVTETYTITGYPAFQALGGTLTLNIRSYASSNNAGATCTVSYSLNGGASFTTVYSISNTTRTLQTDSISLPSNQNLGLIQVQVSNVSGATVGASTEVRFYESYITVIQ